MTALLEAEDVSFAVNGKMLVRNVTFGLAAGRVTVVVGPNGAGKSTLVRLLAGEIAPSSGVVRLAGVALPGIAPWRLSCARAVLPQSSRLAFPFTVREVVRVGLDGIGRGLGAQDRNVILESCLQRADVAHLAGRSYQSLSGGEAQRTHFARVLAQLAAGRTVADRQAALLDEPVASLDLRHQLALLEHATALAAEGVAVLAVLHDLNLAAAFGDVVVAMDAGRIVAQGPPEVVLSDALLSSVFGVRLKVGETPPGGGPFVLPRRGGVSLRAA